uniref:Tubby-like F-box protein n=1 Tax=Rhizophora mucronata TaxID=61149 RepID=A0A2P2MFP4_RHIMU
MKHWIVPSLGPGCKRNAYPSTMFITDFTDLKQKICTSTSYSWIDLEINLAGKALNIKVDHLMQR